jgi:hypothetical protein
MQSASKTLDTELVRSCNWRGAIPVVLTLAPTSLGTTMMPHPCHVMLNRASYLHVGLRSAIQRLHKFAPATISFASGMIVRNEPEPQGDDDDEEEDGKPSGSSSNDNKHSNETTTSKAQQPWKFPVCWLEDEETQIPLRWHIFAGVLFDMLTKKAATSPTPQIPWKIRLHFSNYPSSQLLPLEEDQVWSTIERTFKNSLKQALFLQHGNSKVAMNNMTKQVHERLWDSIVSSNYKLYQQINAELQATEKQAIQLIPVRLYLDSKPPLQRPCRGGEF